MESMEWSGVGVGMELGILNFSETSLKRNCNTNSVSALRINHFACIYHFK
jgi:hypothetical protein